MDEERICLKDVHFTRFYEKERKEIRWMTFVWKVQHYNKLKEDVMYFRKLRWFGENWSIKLTKTQKLLFLILRADDAKLFVNFTIPGKDGKALNEGVASEIVSGQYVADINRDLLTEKNGYLVDDQLTIQCNYMDKSVHDALPHGNPSNYLEQKAEIHCLRMDLQKAYVDEICSDFKIFVPPMEVNVHKAVLVARTRLFAKIFEEGSLQGNDTEMLCEEEPFIFDKMLQYIYTARFDETSVDDVLVLFKLAVIFGVKSLVSECSKFLSRNMTVDNVGAIFVMASKCICVDLRNQAFRFMAKEFPELLKKDEVKKCLNP